MRFDLTCRGGRPAAQEGSGRENEAAACRQPRPEGTGPMRVAQPVLAATNVAIAATSLRRKDPRMLLTPHRVQVRLLGTDVEFETGRIARQAQGAVLARCGDNVVLATVVAAETPKPGQDFFPLTVEYREKYAAVGRIPGGFGRREGRITDHEVLVSRLIDRTVRSLFPEEYRCDVQIQVTVLSAEPSSDLESLSILAAAAALHVSPVPARGPGGGLRIARVDGQWLPFANQQQRARAELEFSVGIGPDGLVMLEGQAHEVDEATALLAITTATEWIGRFQTAFTELRTMAAAAPKAAIPAAPTLPELPAATRGALQEALRITTKSARRAATAAAEQAFVATLADDQRALGKQAFALAVWTETRELALAHGRRLDGRGTTDIRPIACEVGLLPRAHGSALFTRGETQAIATCTLGSPDDALRYDGLDPHGVAERFLLHYNFPPYSVGEIRPLRGPGRREIGHGSLARRGLRAVLPPHTEYPYTIRIESEITESNGSSSMATVCGGTLAMLHAGVPLRAPVAGIAMGLITDGTRHAVLSDILGDEDHLGDMDFKVVGSAQGITAIQLDNKVGGLTLAVLEQALHQARDGRLHILAEMQKTLAAPAEPSRFVPRAARTAVMPDAIGALIGTRGANIKAITEATGAKVAVDDAGEVLVYATDQHSARRAMQMVQRAAGVLKVGRCYRGTVTGVKDFGAFVKINAVNEGLVPVEELDHGPVRHAGDIAREGEEMLVCVLGADDRGRLRLSRRQALGVGEDQIEF
ncbi:MAG: polyribonucleotide nucleotidyltransferase [Planctomycetes bacterium]|nr:polyribonucleotide nucleotidyltransferase [Planctomycetota bacterium]